MAYNWTTEWPGVYAQHGSDCPLRSGGDCTCPQIAYRATAKAPDERSRVLSPEFSSAIAARNWLRDQRARVTAATAVADEGPSLKSVIYDFVDAATRGLDRGGGDRGASQERLRQVRDGLGYIGAELAARRIQTVRRRDLQALIDQLDGAGMPADRINAVISALRVLFAYAIQRDLVDFNPIVQLRLPEAPAPQPVWPDIGGFTSQYNGNGNGNGTGYETPNGNGNGHVTGTGFGDDPDATAPYAPAFTAPFAPPMSVAPDDPTDHWTPGVFDRFEFRDDPFDTEPPAAAPRAPWVASDPLEGEPYAAEPAFAPPAASMPLAAPPPPPPAAPPHTPPPAPPHTPLPPAAPHTPPPPAAPVQPFATTETRYGTPTYGTEAVSTTQAPAHDPGGSPPADNVMLSEQMFWWITRIVVIVFVLIALVLAAESV